MLTNLSSDSTILPWLSWAEISWLPARIFAPLTVGGAGNSKIGRSVSQCAPSSHCSTRPGSEGTECPITRVILVCNKPAPRCQLGVTAEPPSRARGGGVISARICSSWNIIYVSHPARKRLSCDPFDPATLRHSLHQAGVGSTILIHTSNPAMIAPPTASSRKLHLGYEM